ncbi:MAG TPA: hypothetical protein VFR57_10025 [Burkholderiales bacterium]|nr:hypothetical protein [Burkholderiales bacterium]
MRRAAFILFLFATSAGAAELRGDAIFLCDALRQPSIKSSEATAYGKLADALAAAVGNERTRPEVARFLAVLRNPQGRSFDVAPEGNTEKIFRSVPAETITISCAPSVPQYLVEVATAALLAERIRIEHELPVMKTRAAILEKASRDAEDLLKNGLAMWPWELWLNGLRLSDKDADPLFRTQWVVLRPSAGIEIDLRSQSSADLQASVMLEPLGFVRYRGDSYAHWWGASLVVTSSTRRGAGIGALLRWDNYVIGLTRHKGEGSEPDSTFLMVGVDLYDLVNKKRTELKDWDAFARLRSAP